MKDKILNLLIDIFIIIAIFSVFLIVYSKIIKQDKITTLFGKAILVVSTGSMEPNINAGDMIIISKEHNYRVGDIVTFDDDGIIVTHRITKVQGENIYTKGDANDLGDDVIGLDDVYGRVIYRSQICGFIILHLLKPFVLLYFAMIILIYIYKNISGNSNDKEVVINEGKKI